MLSRFILYDGFMSKNAKSEKIVIIAVICVAAVLLFAIGGWVYTEQQNRNQANSQFQLKLKQDKELKEYEQQQLNKRTEVECMAKKSSNDVFAWADCKIK